MILRQSIYPLAAALLITAGTATARPVQKSHGDAAQQLRESLAAAVLHGNGANPPGQNARPDDPDQGDDNASSTAIFEVCTGDTPAAERSAICDRGPPVSPY
jgi:hypothetical protein